MLRRVLGALLIPILSGMPARGQYVAPGSTIQGDYLRGVGIAAEGMGIFNERTATANSINTDTFIRWNEYVNAVIKNGSRELAERRAAARAREKEEHDKLHQRYRENPEHLDVIKGEALNILLNELMNPKISESTFRSAEVPLSTDTVRRIPFKLAEKKAIFSMSRLSLKGKGKWPVAFRGPRFAPYLRAYELALDNALEEAIEGKIQMPAIHAVDKAVDDLERKLNDEVGPSRDTVYLEAQRRLNELKKVVELLKTQKIERTLGEIDRYSGTTVNDLRLFMQKHGLTFAPADSPEEKELYPDLYASLALQREKVMGALPSPDK